MARAPARKRAPTAKSPVKRATKGAGKAAARRPSRATRGRREENKEATKERITMAALELFQSKGFGSTTTKEIARKADIAEGTVFNYFPTKEDIALHFFALEVDRAIAEVRGKPRLRNAPLEEKLFALVQSQFDFLEPYQRFIGTAFVEALKPSSKLGPFSHKAQELRHRYVGFVQELLEESLPQKTYLPISWWAPDAFYIYYLTALMYWLHDSSPNKENTLAFLDRTLALGVAVLKGTK